MTKQLNSVTLRAAAGAGDDAPGRQELEIGQRLRRTARPTSAWSRSGAASAVATRRQVSSMVLSSGSPGTSPLAGAFSRYFMSQICCEIAATRAMGEFSSWRPSLRRQHCELYSSSFVRGKQPCPLAVSPWRPNGGALRYPYLTVSARSDPLLRNGFALPGSPAKRTGRGSFSSSPRKRRPKIESGCGSLWISVDAGGRAR